MSKINVKRIMVIVGVLIIPLLYSYFYLGAFWDPYASLDKLPVAIINEDQSAMINGVKRNLGDEMVQKLKDDGSMKFVFTNATEAAKGLENRNYYAEVTIPSDFSKSIASATTSKKLIAHIKYSPDEKRNYLASQILNRAMLQIEENTRSSIDKEIVASLTDKLNEVPAQLSVLDDGIAKIYDGVNALSTGSTKLNNGASLFSKKFTQLDSGISQLKDGSKTLHDGSYALESGINDILVGTQKLADKTKNLKDLSNGTAALSAGMAKEADGVKSYVVGVDSLLANSKQTATIILTYASTHPEIMNDPSMAALVTALSSPQAAESLKTLSCSGTLISGGADSLSQNAKQLSAGAEALPIINDSIGKISTGLQAVKDGSGKLVNGSGQLLSGATLASDGSSKLATATKDIRSGIASLNSGSSLLKDGTLKAKSGVETSIKDANTQLKPLNGIDEFASAPVTVEQTSINAIPNYGTAFSPYFMSLSLWVGGLIIFVGIFLDSDGKFSVLSRDSNKKVKRTFIYLLIALGQALVLAVSLQFALDLHIKNLALYYFSCALVSVVFMSIIQFLFIHLKDLGKFLSILLLILQLTSCGGTFPMETVPKIFNILNPFMPMTYSVNLFKEAISGSDTAFAVQNILILFAILVVFVGLTIVLSVAKRTRHRIRLRAAAEAN